MKIILLKDVAKVGQRGSVVDVADGFALNSLIPRGLAEQATAAKIAAHAAQVKQEEAAHEEATAALRAIVKNIENSHLELALRASEKGGLFKAVTAADIAKALLDQRHVTVPAEYIQLEHPIKQTGGYAITVKASGVEAHLTLSIIPAETR